MTQTQTLEFDIRLTQYRLSFPLAVETRVALKARLLVLRAELKTIPPSRAWRKAA
jgi:hypothetical protein